ncbi:MAG: type I methionyl aminopeptidase [Opitutaceae bacterium]|nr:type I methionyl aminopeptidase [Opitutaceae bacterium]|tara:strand:- start:578 stop:1345 length:768 start_codon:yes stop_codon:yes gene_type:complete
MIPVKNSAEILSMRTACEVAATVLYKVVQLVEPGVSTYDLDQAGKEFIRELGAKSACYNYRNGSKIYPGYICTSINEEIVHGIGSMRKTIQSGDAVSVDVVISYDGFIGDNAKTVIVGDVSENVRHLVDSTRESLDYAIGFARPGGRVGDISNAVQTFIESRGLSIVRDFVGHGVGRSMHEEPQIPNYGHKNKGDKLKPGMTLAIEPMVNLGSSGVRMLSDGWTAVTVDGQPSAHFEHTVLINQDGPEVLTLPKK